MARLTKKKKQQKSKKMRKTYRHRNNRKLKGGCGPSGTCGLMQGGGCDCDSSKIITGGHCPCQDALKNTPPTTLISGGTNPYFNLSTTPYYSFNDHNQDPQDPLYLQNARLLKGGRKSKKSKKSKKNKKMIKGGIGYSDFLLGENNNHILSFGTTSGASLGSDLTMGKHIVDPAPYVQPVIEFGNHNRVLV